MAELDDLERICGILEGVCGVVEAWPLDRHYCCLEGRCVEDPVDCPPDHNVTCSGSEEVCVTGECAAIGTWPEFFGCDRGYYMCTSGLCTQTIDNCMCDDMSHLYVCFDGCAQSINQCGTVRFFLQ